MCSTELAGGHLPQGFPLSTNAAPVFWASVKLEWMFVRASTPKEVRACPLDNALHPLGPWKPRRGFLGYCQTWGAIFASFRENKHSRWKVTRINENAHARPSGAATAGRTEVLLLHWPFRPTYFSLVLSILSRTCIFFYHAATVSLLEPSRRGLEITVSSCVRYLDLEGREYNPFVRGSCLRGLDLSKLTSFILTCLTLIDTKRDAV